VTRACRAGLLLLGLAFTAYGVLRVLDLGWANTRAALVWLVGGIVLHDAVLAPAVLILTLVALRLVRRDLLGPWAVALVVLVPTTLVGVPELGRFGADPHNPTLLDRHYWLGWSVLVTLVVVAVVLRTVGHVVAARGRTATGDADEARR
jgi:hypothetical protein